MTSRRKPSAKVPARPVAPPAPAAQPAARPGVPSGNATSGNARTGNERWQRTVRYTWDKGGSRGGRH